MTRTDDEGSQVVSNFQSYEQRECEWVWTKCRALSAAARMKCRHPSVHPRAGPRGRSLGAINDGIVVGWLDRCMATGGHPQRRSGPRFLGAMSIQNLTDGDRCRLHTRSGTAANPCGQEHVATKVSSRTRVERGRHQRAALARRAPQPAHGL